MPRTRPQSFKVLGTFLEQDKSAALVVELIKTIATNSLLPFPHARDTSRNFFLVSIKDLSLKERPAQYQLVGRVMAYQGKDA